MTGTGLSSRNRNRKSGYSQPEPELDFQISVAVKRTGISIFKFRFRFKRTGISSLKTITGFNRNRLPFVKFRFRSKFRSDLEIRFLPEPDSIQKNPVPVLPELELARKILVPVPQIHKYPNTQIIK